MENNKTTNEEKNEEKVNKIDEKKNNKLNLKNNKKIFWTFFWGVIIILIFITLGIEYIGLQKNTNSVNDKTFLEEVVNKFYSKYPKIFKIYSELDKKTRKEIIEAINKQIDKAYEPVYEHIDDFVDFHFSVTGEYKEIATLIFSKTQNILIEKIFKPANFDENMQYAFENINENVKNIISKNFDELKDKLKDIGFTKEEINVLLDKILQISKDELNERFKNKEYNLIRGLGVSSTAMFGIVVSKKISTLIAKKISTKITTKIALKTGGKLAIKMVGSGGSAAAGAETGLLVCGPVCAAIGGIAGGIIGWFATDKIVIEVDKYFNKDEFKQEVVNLINQEKNDTKKMFYYLFIKSSEDVSELVKKRFNDLKQKPIIENLKH